MLPVRLGVALHQEQAARLERGRLAGAVQKRRRKRPPKSKGGAAASSGGALGEWSPEDVSVYPAAQLRSCKKPLAQPTLPPAPRWHGKGRGAGRPN
jgi:hypothetical protein